MQNPAVARGDCKMHETNRLARGRAARPRYSGNGNRKIDAGSLQRAHRHRCRGFLADRAKRRKCRRFDAEHGALGLV